MQALHGFWQNDTKVRVIDMPAVVEACHAYHMTTAREDVGHNRTLFSSQILGLHVQNLSADLDIGVQTCSNVTFSRIRVVQEEPPVCQAFASQVTARAIGYADSTTRSDRPP